MSWQPADGDRIRCDLHGETFGRLEVCRGCAAQPAVAVAPSDPGGERSAQAIADEGWCRAQRDAVLAVAVKLIEERGAREAIDRVGYSTIGKLYETALRFHRAAVEERRLEDDKEHERVLVRAAREMRQRGAAH